MVPCRVHSSTAGFLTCWGSIAFVLWGRISPCQLWFSFKRFCCFSFNLVIRFVNCYSMRIWLFWLTTLLLTRALKFDIGRYFFFFSFLQKQSISIEISTSRPIQNHIISSDMIHIGRYLEPWYQQLISPVSCLHHQGSHQTLWPWLSKDCLLWEQRIQKLADSQSFGGSGIFSQASVHL